jgi:15-cis-phytoene synthase
MSLASRQTNPLMTPAAYCRQRTLKANTSFYYPIKLLSPPRQAAMYALYAFCREVDDVVDEANDPRQAREQLAFWRKDLDRAFSQANPEHPVSIELSQAIVGFNLPTAPFYDLIDGMEMDLNQQRFKNREELTVYCRKVAVAVGLIAIPIFCLGTSAASQDNERMSRFAHHLGMALQLTNILRDINEDAERGRIYIPQSLLSEYGLSEADLLAGRWCQSLGQALTQLGIEAENHFQAAETLITDRAERNCLFPALVMSGIYRRYLIILKQRGFDSLTRPLKLSSPTKLLLTVKIWLNERILNR